MAVSPLQSPVILDGIVSAEKLAELLAFGAEYPELDFKTKIDPAAASDIVELACDVGAMQVRGGYIVCGVDNSGKPTRDLDGVDIALFDEARLRTKLLKYQPDPLEIRSAAHDVGGCTVVLIFIGPHPSGCAFFHTEGQYTRNSKQHVRFRKGDVFWRNGTSSERLSQHGFEEIIDRRIASMKADWLEEQLEIRRREREEATLASEARRLVIDAPLGAVNFDLPAGELRAAVLEMIRVEDKVGLIHLFEDLVPRARDAIVRDEIETEVGDIADKLACLAAAFLQYDEPEWFDRTISALAQIYALPLSDRNDADRFDYQTRIDPSAQAPRVWLQVIVRVFAVGALAVRREDWAAVRTLTLQLPPPLDKKHYGNWLRHALTMASRAQHLEEQGQTTSLLTLARACVQTLDCLRPDGLHAEDELVTSSLAQFDVLANVVGIDGAGAPDAGAFYPNFAQFRQQRIQETVERLLIDDEMRQALFAGTDEQLAIALREIGKVAGNEGRRYAGFDGWARTPVGDFIAATLSR